MKRPSTLHVVPQPQKVDNRIGLMNPDFKYTRAAETDVRATFDRIRQQLAAKGKK